MGPVLARLRRPARWLLIALVALVTLEVLYLLGGNVLLRTGLLRSRLNQDPEMFRVRYGSAYTLVPGVIHARDVRVRAQDTYIEWTLTVQEVRFRVGLLALFGRTAALSGVRASGAAFRLRIKLDPLDAMPEHERVLAPIAGYADPPIRLAGPPRASPPVQDEWRIRLTDVDAALRELWVHELRFVGDARLQSGPARSRGPQGFRLVLGGHDMSLGPSTLTVRSGEVRLGGQSVTPALRGKITARIDRVDLGQHLDRRALRAVSGTVRLVGALQHLDALNYYFRELPAVRLREGRGRFDVSLRLERGVLLAPGGWRLAGDGLGARVGALYVQGHLTSRLALSDKQPLRLRARVDQLRLGSAGARWGMLVSDGIDLGLTMRRPDLAGALEGVEAWATAARIRAPALAGLAPALPGWLRPQSGRGWIEDVRVGMSTAPTRVTSTGRFGLEQATVKIDGVPFRVDARGALRLQAPPSGLVEMAGHVELRRLAGATGDALSGRIDVPWLALEDGRIDARLAFRLGTADDLVSSLVDRLDTALLPSAALGLLDHDGLHGTFALHVGPGLRLDELDVRGDNYRLRGRIGLLGAPRARLLLEVGPLSFGVAMAGGDTDVVVLGASRWFRQGERGGTH